MMMFGLGFGMLGMLLFWVLLIVLGVLAVRALFPPQTVGQRRTTPNDPRRILDERYARGEITREQYEQMRRDLEG